ncbi:c-type cytochrome [Rhodoluna limnophila]|jgi:ubiquinol-cytochrome c reductase cytochrome c subunit|uniref:cytochrome bc1 complex diheme cytochrome c subunit n=1 Tax=Rhodoluna limnophila TaxID=232537 RepID=UPI001105C007|nr:cytochrome c [Rhodoluna limnophila]
MAFMKNKGSRRSPFAAVLVMAAGLALTGGGYAAATAAVEQVKPASAVASAAQVEEGRKLFLANCASCHGKAAEGSAAGPSLIGVGAASVDFQVGTGRMPGQASGPQLEAKKVQFTQEQIDSLAAYVASLAPGPAVPTEEMLAADGDATRGGELFRINCAMCHNAVGAGGALTEGKFAPALKGVESKHIYEAMVTGPQNMPVFNDANLTPEDKKDIITYLKYVEENPSAGGYELANLGPVVEGLFAWVFVLGLIIAITIWLGAKSN